MPSIVLGTPPASGATLVIQGSFYSGCRENLGIGLLWVSSGGNAYISMSGGGPPLSGGFMTVNSGGIGSASGGLLDGMCIPPGRAYFIEPAMLTNQGGLTSGQFNIYAQCDASASGVGRLYFDTFLGFRG